MRQICAKVFFLSGCSSCGMLTRSSCCAGEDGNGTKRVLSPHQPAYPCRLALYHRRCFSLKGEYIIHYSRRSKIALPLLIYFVVDVPRVLLHGQKLGLTISKTAIGFLHGATNNFELRPLWLRRRPECGAENGERPPTSPINTDLEPAPQNDGRKGAPLSEIPENGYRTAMASSSFIARGREGAWRSGCSAPSFLAHRKRTRGHHHE